jgi:hypothetical protein
MIKPKKILITIISLSGLIIFSGWGTVGHRKINQHAPASFPHSMEFLKASWTILLAAHGSDADKRKAWDPDEEVKHYIDIDNYPEFLLNGKIPQTYDSVVALHGESFVLDQGTLPWATLIAFDSLKNCFQRMDWNKAGLFASDLGHYVADGHQPLHLTRNYNGQYSGQDEIHSRYESKMIGTYQNEIVYNDDSAFHQIQDVKGYVFSYIYYNYQDLDSLLFADSIAYAVAGHIYSGQYYPILWDSCKGFTIDLFKRASYSLAELIYTAWVQAGSPVMSANAIDEFSSAGSLNLQNFPNPFFGETTIRFFIKHSNSTVLLQIYDITGNVVTTLKDDKPDQGVNEIRWDATGYKPGIYYIRLKTDVGIETIKAVLFR